MQSFNVQLTKKTQPLARVVPDLVPVAIAAGELSAHCPDFVGERAVCQLPDTQIFDDHPGVPPSQLLGWLLHTYVTQNRLAAESAYRDDLHRRVGGQTEVQTPSGRIDVLTPTVIYEVKHSAQWKHALGQVLAYSVDKPGRTPCVALFGRPSQKKARHIENVCRAYRVKVLWLD